MCLNLLSPFIVGLHKLYLVIFPESVLPIKLNCFKLKLKKKNENNTNENIS